MILKTNKNSHEEELLEDYADIVEEDEETIPTDNMILDQMILSPDDTETDYIDEDMIDEESIIIDDETGEIIDNPQDILQDTKGTELNQMSGEEYMMAKLNACNMYYSEPECDKNCPLNVEGTCLHADIKTSVDYKKCEERLAAWKESLRRTNGYIMQEILKKAGIDFSLSYLSPEGKSWYERKAI